MPRSGACSEHFEMKASRASSSRFMKSKIMFVHIDQLWSLDFPTLAWRWIHTLSGWSLSFCLLWLVLVLVLDTIGTPRVSCQLSLCKSLKQSIKMNEVFFKWRSCLPKKPLAQLKGSHWNMKNLSLTAAIAIKILQTFLKWRFWTQDLRDVAYAA